MIFSWTWGWLYRLCCDTLVSSSWTSCRWYAIWTTGRCLGNWMRFCWTTYRCTVMAWPEWRGSVIPHRENFGHDFFFFCKKAIFAMCQLYLCIATGDLIDRHKTIFSQNQYFKGLSIPEPAKREPLEEKLPLIVGKPAMDFLKVCCSHFLR